ncbi:uncharacterized protein LOC131065693 [Cryptomeria japonica]|uniref:uncharacterized protein LOC131065693 n=1 Tax=Cryptomeria japonica TaxID=3369 RepID=UPI0025AB72BA|nr:uncharacterized protein LOC131065693 [Cryptomeria japonica]
MNFDGASRGNPGKFGYGAIIRNEFGNFVWAKYGSLGINTNMAELAGLLDGLEWCVAHGIQDVEVEGDSQIILNGISNQNFENWKLERLTEKEELPDGLIEILVADKDKFPKSGIG